MDLVPKIIRRFSFFAALVLGLVGSPVQIAVGQNWKTGQSNAMNDRNPIANRYASLSQQPKAQQSFDRRTAKDLLNNWNHRAGAPSATTPQTGNASRVTQPGAVNSLAGRSKNPTNNSVRFQAVPTTARQIQNSPTMRPLSNAGHSSMGIQVTPVSRQKPRDQSLPPSNQNRDQNNASNSQDFLNRKLPGLGSSPDSDNGTKKGATTGTEPFIQAGIGLAVVLPLAVIFLFVMKRATPKSMLGLPQEAIEVLGNTALDSKHHLKLIRLGNKLVLLSVSDGNVQPVSEVQDPEEVGRLVAMCQNRNKREVTSTFQSILRSGESDQSSGFLGSQQDQVPVVGVNQRQNQRRQNSSHQFEA